MIRIFLISRAATSESNQQIAKGELCLYRERFVKGSLLLCAVLWVVSSGELGALQGTETPRFVWDCQDAPGPETTRVALLPAYRIVAYYGNPLSARMGILGELPPDRMLARLHEQALAFAEVDTIPVWPALQLVAVVAQRSPGRDGLYRARMPDSLIEKVALWAERCGYLLILDVQIGHSSVADEVRTLVPFLRRPYVHLALDPEFAMKGGQVPGRVIGSLDAADVNVAIELLAELVEANKLPPKILIVHCFEARMLTNPHRLRLDPNVQIAINMDGFGSQALKRNSYKICVHDRNASFAGIKLFYKQDTGLMTPAQVLALNPVPHVVIYQ